MPVLPGGNFLPPNPLLGTDEGSAGVKGQSNRGPGVLGQSLGLATPGSLTQPGTDGVLGEGNNGVRGLSGADYGSGKAPAGPGVWGENTAPKDRVTGQSGGPGVYGTSATGDGILGDAYHGVHGQSSKPGGSGVWGEDTGSGTGVSGTSESGVAVQGVSASHHAIAGQTAKGVAVYGQSTDPAGNAGHFDGNVTIIGTATVSVDVVLSGSDCAEQFDTAGAQPIEPGTVVVIDEEGVLRESLEAYDRKVAGVVSGAGDYRPAIILDKRPSGEDRAAVALVGKVCCKADAQYAPINVGDLLTTSPTPGHAMKAAEPGKAFGAVIGKALRRLDQGRGLIPILIALQ